MQKKIINKNNSLANEHAQQKEDGLKRKSLSILAGLSISMLAFNSVEALNIGEARSQSYLGEPLNIFIPVDNSGEVINFNQLIVSKPTVSQLSALDVSPSTGELIYQVINEGTQQGILITSNQPYTEPFVNLGLKVDYDGASQLKKLTALIDFEPLVSEVDGSITGSALIEPEQKSTLLESNISSNVDISIAEIASTGTASFGTASTGIAYTSEQMGPYDWARAGAIPEKFGPVLEGQSLWRVARRINESMDVSIDQMMWGLFKANPQAFSGNEVTTLKAGSVLTIPDESLVREVTEMGAVRLLNPQLAESTTTAIDDQTAEVVSENIDAQPVEESLETALEINEQTTEQTTTNIELAEAGVDEAGLTEESSIVNEIVTEQESLIATVDADVTEAQASETEIANEAVSESVLSLSTVNEIDDLKNEVNYLTQQVGEQELRIQELEQRLLEAETAAAAFQNSISTDTPVIESNASVNSADNTAFSSFDNSSIKVWSLGALAIFLLGLAYLARNQIAKLFGGGEEQHQEIAPTIVDAQSESTEQYEAIVEHQTVEGNYEETSFIDNVAEYEEPEAEDEEEENQIEPNSDFQDIIEKPGRKNPDSDGFEDFEDYSFFVADEELMDVEELSFPDRIKQLIDSGDYDEAKKTVDFAKVADVDEHDINVYLLKIFSAEGDRESFNKLFDKIHANLEHYDADAQLTVAQLQSEMAIGQVINFNMDKIAS